MAAEAACAYSLKGDPALPVEGVTVTNVEVRRWTGGPDHAENIKGFRKD